MKLPKTDWAKRDWDERSTPLFGRDNLVWTGQMVPSYPPFRPVAFNLTLANECFTNLRVDLLDGRRQCDSMRLSLDWEANL